MTSYVITFLTTSFSGSAPSLDTGSGWTSRDEHMPDMLDSGQRVPPARSLGECSVRILEAGSAYVTIVPGAIDPSRLAIRPVAAGSGDRLCGSRESKRPRAQRSVDGYALSEAIAIQSALTQVPSSTGSGRIGGVPTVARALKLT